MRAIPYLILLIEAALFFRHVLFFDYSIPWDLGGFFLPHTLVYSDALRAGELPLWDPYMYCGRPLQANIQAAVFYPPVAMVAWLGSLIGDSSVFYLLELNVIAHALAAGIFSYWLGLALGLSRPSALLAGTVCQLGGFFAVHASHMTAVQVAAWIPFVLWCVVRMKQGSLWRHGLLLAAGYAMSILAGLAPLTAALVGVAALLAILLRFDWRRSAVFLTAGLAAVVLTIAQLLPTFELTNLSIAQYRSDYLKSGGGLPLEALVSLVAPNYYGVFDPSTYRAPFELTYLYLYCGIPALLLAIAAIRRNLIWSCMLAASGFAMLGDATPLGRALHAALPLQIRIGLHPEYTSAAFVLCIAVLAAFGLEQTIRNERWRWALLAVCASDLILVSSGRPMNAMPLKTEPVNARTQFGGDSATLARLRRLANQRNPPSRFDTTNGAMQWAMASPTLALPGSNGNDPFALTRLMQARLSFSKGERWGSYYEVENFRSPVLGLMNTGFIIARSPIGAEALQDSPFVLREHVPGYSIYENTATLPRFRLVSRVRSAGSEAEALALLRSAGFRPAQEAIVEAAPAAPLDGGEDHGTVRVEEYGLNTVKLFVHAPSRRYLVTSEAHYPGWKAELDGQPWPLHYTNVAFRGLEIPPGDHTVEMRFSPTLLWWTGGISLAGWLLWCLLWWLRARGEAVAPGEHEVPQHG